MQRFQIAEKDFGTFGTDPVKRYDLLDTETGTEIRVTPFGATLVGVRTPDIDKRLDEVVLGHEDVSGYVDGKSYQGASVGRWANRIGGAVITLNGQTYRLMANEGPNALHGGAGGGFSKKLWVVDHDIIIANDKFACIRMSHTSPDGDNGFPGKVDASVSYTLDASGMGICHDAETDRCTVYNPTNHGYWNLRGADSGFDINGHVVRIDAGKFLEVDGNLIPTGRKINVEESEQAAGVSLDFRTPRKVGGSKIDHCYVFHNDGGLHEAYVFCPETGRLLKIRTPDMGMQFYTGNFLGKDGREDTEGFFNRQGLCLEDQRLPDAMNKPDELGFGPYMLVRGLPYHKLTRYEFSIARSL